MNNSNPPTPTNINTVESLLDSIWAYGVDWTEYRDKNDTDHEVATYAAKIKSEMKDKMREAIKQLQLSLLDTVSKRLWSYDDYEVGNEKLKAYRQGWDEATKEAQNTLNAIRKELEEG